MPDCRCIDAFVIFGVESSFTANRFENLRDMRRKNRMMVQAPFIRELPQVGFERVGTKFVMQNPHDINLQERLVVFAPTENRSERTRCRESEAK